MKHAAALLALAAIWMAAPSVAAAQQCARPMLLYFPLGSADVDKESGYPLLGIAWQQAGAEGRIDLNGHADASERPDLGLERAAAIAALFVQEGMASGRVTATGSGSSRPAVNVAGPEPLNRRLEICVVP
jgi:outer membrane protein OmpA-like peptidoglycan-associated protein